jgi:polysaccharide biosynthesis/export protein
MLKYVQKQLLIPLLLILASCAQPVSIERQPAALTNTLTQYLLGVGDQIAIQVWKTPELSVSLPIRPDGKVSIPLLGDVMASGLTAAQLSKQLTEAFTPYVRNPQVTVVVLQPLSADYLLRVRITGAVEKPISINHQQGMTVLDLVLEAGGVSEYARPNNAKLYRKYGDKVEVFPIYLGDILNKGDVSTNYVLAPSDIITVPERLF